MIIREIERNYKYAHVGGLQFDWKIILSFYEITVWVSLNPY